ncbi:ligase-associated DNA damage response exonuclease [soil metagenome]
MGTGSKLLKVNSRGLFCEKGNFYIDPWRPVEKALITHGHSDHARPGMEKYLTHKCSKDILKLRLGGDINVQTVEYGESIGMNGVKVSFHPAGHILGSSQIRLKGFGEVAVVTGDYKIHPDKTCAAFEPLKCNTFLTESTFALPIYCWQKDEEVFSDINGWWKKNIEAEKTGIIYCYSLGKAQRILSGMDSSLGKIYTHGAVENINAIYRKNGIKLPETINASEFKKGDKAEGSIVIAPPSASGTPWLRKFGNITDSFASGWMQVRGNRRRRNIDKGFVLSDHCDWKGLLKTIEYTDAENILITHGFSDILSKYLNETGFNAHTLETRFEGESEND